MLRRTLQPVLLVSSMFAGGTLGHHSVEDASWWNSFFMTVITLIERVREHLDPLRGDSVPSVLGDAMARLDAGTMEEPDAEHPVR